MSQNLGGSTLEKDYHYVVTPNSDIIVKMQDDAELKQASDEADLILTDGQIWVKISHYLGNPIKERVCMTDFVWDVFDLAIENNYGVFLFGDILYLDYNTNQDLVLVTKIDKNVLKSYKGKEKELVEQILNKEFSKLRWYYDM